MFDMRPPDQKAAMKAVMSNRVSSRGLGRLYEYAYCGDEWEMNGRSGLWA